MGTITTLRPSSTSSGVGWTPSAGTLHGVTSDNSDATYATWGGDGSPLILGTPVDSPPAGERRHQVRLRARGEDGNAWWAVRLSSGALAAGAAAEFTASPSTVTGSWGFGAPADGATVLYTYVTGQSTGVKINELYLDVDSREAPTFTPQTLDGSGTATTTISDTAQPIIRASSIDLDDLNARQYRYWVTLNGSIVWDTGVVSGTAPNRQTTALDNGTYVAHLQIWSTLGQSTAYASDEETLEFDVQVGQVAAPDNPTVDQVDGTPFYTLGACAPFVGDLDDGVGYIEIQRVDCPVGGYLLLSGSPGAYASSPDPAQVSGVLDIVMTAQRDDDWRPDTDENLVSHFDTAGDQRGWRIYLDADGGGDPALIGRPVFQWSEDGIVNLAWRANERVPVDPYGVARMRLLFDPAVDELTFYSRETDDSEWVEFSHHLSGVATTIFASSAPYVVGAALVAGVSSERFQGRFYSVVLKDGGTTVLSPDFTNHLDGTSSFSDGQANLWTVSSPASIYSPTSTVTVAMLGPLETGECAEYVDFTLPRSGVGATCDHTPVACCSYYRSRTVGREDGNLRISDWSDDFDPAIPRGVIVMWPDTAASIPDGWDRTTELDGRYPKGIASAVTEPGTIGGSTTHTHTTPGHTHDTSHIHTTAATTAAATGTVNTANTAGALKVLSSHTHTRPSTNSSTVVSGSTSPGTDTENNDPARLAVIFIESDGTQLGVPDAALVLADDISLSGWTDYADATNRFLKGAAPAGDGGATAVSSLDSHLHAIDAHTHIGTAHVHTSSNTGAATSTLAPATGTGSVISAANHSHPITVASGNTSALGSAAGGDSGTSGALDPPYRNLRVKENTGGVPDLPIGIICAWRGSLGSIPSNWALCDGTDGTPDMTGRYPRGATASIGTTGGSLSGHTHTSGSHTHSTTGHSHTSSTGAATATTTTAITTATVVISTAAHTHALTDTASTTPTVANAASGTLASATSEPPFEEVAFIQMVDELVPPPEPDTFCLDWTDEEHLIRTTGPDGPLWAPVLGRFEWAVERPFTAATGVNGSRFVTSAPPGGRNLSMTAAVENEDELAQLRAVLSRPLVLISPSDASEVWAAPVQESVRIVRVGRIRQVTASFVGTGPQPPPQLADVGV